MNKKNYIIAFILGAFFIAGCVQTPGVNQETGDTNASDVVVDTESASADEVVNDDAVVDGDNINVGTDPRFVSYENKAALYTIMRPDNWYWRHYIRPEIGDSKPNVDDYFFTDLVPLAGLSTDGTARILIEVSRIDPTVFSDIISLPSRKVTIDGVDATRYEGMLSLIGSNTKTIQYMFIKNEQTYRLVYLKENSSEAEEEVFEKLVSSFMFVN